MRVKDPAVQFAAAAASHCLSVADDIVDLIAVSPATPERSGKLRVSYKAIPEGRGALIVSDRFYWRFQEHGTRKMRARPHVRPAIETVRARNLT